MKIKMEKNLHVLQLVNILPNPNDRILLLRMFNIFVYRQLTHLAKSHRLTCPILVPYFPRLTQKFLASFNRRLLAPSVRNETVDGLDILTLRYMHVPYYHLDFKLRSLLRFVEENRCMRFDLIHCHTLYGLGVCALELKRRLGIPLVVTAYGTDVNWLFEDDPARRASPAIAEATVRVLQGADAAIGVSQDLCARMQQLGVPPEKSHWAPNGVDPAMFSPGDREAERANLGWEPGKKIVLYVGNLLETKGLGELAEAVRLIAGRGRADNLLVKLAGPDGGYQGRLLEKIGKAGLGRNFELLGAVEHGEVVHLIRAADLVCLPSWREGWPNVVVEALACGTPVVATTVGGIVEMLTSDEIGLLVPPREAAPLAEALEKALEKDWDREKIAQAAEPFCYEKVAERIGNIYKILI